MEKEFSIKQSQAEEKGKKRKGKEGEKRQAKTSREGKERIDRRESVSSV